jgi:hypothetical protein
MRARLLKYFLKPYKNLLGALEAAWLLGCSDLSLQISRLSLHISRLSLQISRLSLQ